MNRLTHFNQKTLSYDLINKLNLTNRFQIPTIKQIHINFNFSTQTITKTKIQTCLAILELISGQSGQICLSRKNKIHLKIKKNDIVGCKATLEAPNNLLFIEKLILFIFPYFKDFYGYDISTKQKSTFTFSISNNYLFQLFELNNEFLRFKELPNLDITIKHSASNTKITKSVLTGYQFPIKKD
jgi:ribosomal protein L5